MKDPFDRLMEAARRASQKPVEFEPPFGLETRVIAAWREALAQNDLEDWWKLGRPFIAFASLAMVLSIAFNFHALLNLPQRASQPTELSMAESTIRLALNP